MTRRKHLTLGHHKATILAAWHAWKVWVENYEGVQYVLYYTLGLNLIVMAAKVGVGYWTGSLGIVADGFDSIFDIEPALLA